MADNNQTFALDFNLSDIMRNAAAQYVHAFNRLNDAPEDTSEADEDLLSDAYWAARERVIECPASTVDDLRVKFDVIWLDYGASPPRSSIDCVFRDLHKLSSQKVSPVFQADCWLKWFEAKGGGWIERDDDIVLIAPPDKLTDGCMDELRASGACQIVKDMLRSRRVEA
ncbi:MAG: hypothetical protein R3E21_08360 [Caenibius sp.]